MKKLRDPKSKIYPSTTRGGKELPCSSALDSPSVMSKLATPNPASAIRSDMSLVIVDATSAGPVTDEEHVGANMGIQILLLVIGRRAVSVMSA